MDDAGNRVPDRIEPAPPPSPPREIITGKRRCCQKNRQKREQAGRPPDAVAPFHTPSITRPESATLEGRPG